MASLKSMFILVVLIVVIPASGMGQKSRDGLRRVNVDGIELEYEVRGTGEPVLLIHAGVFAGWFEPLLKQSKLVKQYRVVSYHRVGYAGSSHPSGSISLAQQAAHLRGLMRHLKIERAHIVGHSSGGNIALQLALDAPGLVHSLTIMEPALAVAPSGDERLLSTSTRMSQIMDHFRAGRKTDAVDGFMQMVAGPAYRAVLDQVLPGAFKQAVADADTFFTQELPAVRQWTFSQEDAKRVTQPVLAVIGEKSPEVSQIWSERQRMLLTWLPKAEPFTLSGATHMLHVENPGGMAQGLVAFFGRHPIGTAKN